MWQLHQNSGVATATFSTFATFRASATAEIAALCANSADSQDSHILILITFLIDSHFSIKYKLSTIKFSCLTISDQLIAKGCP
jgi:hypothetical protein